MVAETDLLLKDPGRAQGDPRGGARRGRPAALRRGGLRRGVRTASIVPAYRRGVADAELPADVGLARSIIPPGTAAVARLQPPGAADPGVRRGGLRRLHDLRQRLPGHGHPRDRPAGGRGRAAGRRVRGRRRRTRRPRRRRRRPTSPHARSTPTSRTQAGPGAGLVRDLRRPDPLQGLRRVCRGLSRARLRRPAG